MCKFPLISGISRVYFLSSPKIAILNLVVSGAALEVSFSILSKLMALRPIRECVLFRLTMPLKPALASEKSSGRRH